jgi:hypothetical protein
MRRLVAQLSEWLQLMLAEIARKQEEAQRALEEQHRRAAQSSPQPSQPSQPSQPLQPPQPPQAAQSS